MAQMGYWEALGKRFTRAMEALQQREPGLVGKELWTIDPGTIRAGFQKYQDEHDLFQDFGQMEERLFLCALCEWTMQVRGKDETQVGEKL